VGLPPFQDHQRIDDFFCCLALHLRRVVYQCSALQPQNRAGPLRMQSAREL
jgi:hypothetical protein